MLSVLTQMVGTPATAAWDMKEMESSIASVSRYYYILYSSIGICRYISATVCTDCYFYLHRY